MDPGDVRLRAVDAGTVRAQLGDGPGDVLALESDQVDAFAVLVEEAADGLGRIGRLQELDVADACGQDRVLEAELLGLAALVEPQPEQLGEVRDRLGQILHHDGQLDHVSQHGCPPRSSHRSPRDARACGNSGVLRLALLGRETSVIEGLRSRCYTTRGYNRPMRVILALLLVVAVLPMAGGHAAEPTVLVTTLDNGLRVLLLEDHRSPIVSFQVWYRVGSRNEHRGATGIAHFLEHLMFKGTPTHGKGQFAELVERNGGQDNAFTMQDTTTYFVNIAADKLDLVLELEADRMRNLLLDPREIDSERQVVIEERRTRTEDDPDGFLSEAVNAISFKAHPYGQPTVRSM